LPKNYSFNALFQRVLPQRTITAFFRNAANCSVKPWKNWMIRYFIQKYQVNMNEAIIQNPIEFKNFNDFFIRHLKPELRPIAKGSTTIVSPVDGCVRQIGQVEGGKIFNAKGHFFTLHELLGGNFERCAPFLQGAFANLYLAPRDYHRIHMPCDGTLKSMTYIPGKLFPVKESSVKAIPSLFSQNERAVLFFDTAMGPMVMVLVGAMIVGNIHVVCHGDITREKKIREWDYTSNPHHFKVGDEVGHFRLGSTVIVVFNQTDQTINWESDLFILRYGQIIGKSLPI
jgi:phosphatidylserine decarboxylase